MQFWSKGDSVIGSVEVSPLAATGSDGSVSRLSRLGPWQVGGVVYPSWRDAYVSALRPACQEVHTVPSPSVYFGPRVRSRRLEMVYGSDVISVWDVIREVELAQREQREQRDSAAPAVKISSSVGIDLDRRGHEVRKLFFAGFGHRIKKHGYDPEEVLQEVYQGLLVRNRGKCPFDPSKSSFGHYVHMVAECIINNYHRKHNRRRMNEVAALDLASGMGSSSSDGLTESGVLDRAASLVAEDAGAGLAQSLVAGRIRLKLNEGLISRRQAQLAAEVLPYLASDPSLGRSCPRVGDLAVIGWRYGQPEWRAGVSALRVVMDGAE